MRPIESIILTWSAAVCAASLPLLIVAWRARRIDDHPLCRRCGFDLFGLPPTSTRCPECGRDVTRRRATRRGHRRKHLALLATSLLTLTLTAGVLSFFAVSRARGVNWNRHKPVAWLIRDARVSPAMRDLALDEFTRRLQDGTLSPQALNRVVEVALAHQGNRAEAWVPRWGLFIEQAHDLGRLDARFWRRYLEQAAYRFELQARDTIRSGAPLPVRIVTLPERVGTPGKLQYDSRVSYHVDGQLVTTFGPADHNSSDPWPAPRPRVDTLLSLPRPTSNANRFRREIAATLLVTVRDDSENLTRQSQRVGQRRRAPSKPFTAAVWAQARRQELRFTKTVTVVDDPNPLVQPVSDESIAAAVEQSITIFVQRSPEGLSVTVTGASPPVDLAFNAVITWPGAQYELGSILFHAGQHERITVPVRAGGRSGLSDLKQVDVTLAPDPLAAEQSTDIKRIWARVIHRAEIPVSNLRSGR